MIALVLNSRYQVCLFINLSRPRRATEDHLSRTVVSIARHWVVRTACAASYLSTGPRHCGSHYSKQASSRCRRHGQRHSRTLSERSHDRPCYEESMTDGSHPPLDARRLALVRSNAHRKACEVSDQATRGSQFQAPDDRVRGEEFDRV